MKLQTVFESAKLYVCDQGNGRIRVVNLRMLFCYASQIVPQDAEENQSEEQDCAVRRIGKVHVHDLSLISEGNVPDLVSPFAICASAKDSIALFVSDVKFSSRTHRSNLRLAFFLPVGKQKVILFKNVSA